MTTESAEPEEIAAACGFDPTKPNAARVYDYLLGGKDNFAADRQAAAQLTSALPDVPAIARANRSFLAAAVRYVAEQGIGQYVDIGAGLPTAPNVHDSARMSVPDARVAYVDNDPVVVTHARALLATDDLVTVISADARDHESILAAPELTVLIDFSKPVCALFVSVLHFLPASMADAAVAAFRERMAPGSYLVLSVGQDDVEDLPVREQVQAAYGSGTILAGRSAAEIAALFGDFELVPPGIVPVTEWPLATPDAPPGAAPPAAPELGQQPSVPVWAGALCGIGRKPG